MNHQLAQFVTLVRCISSATGAFLGVPNSPMFVHQLTNILAFTICRTRTLTYALNHRVLLPDVPVVFGPLPPSRCHVCQIYRIMRSEAHQQANFIKDSLKTHCLLFFEDKSSAMCRLSSVLRSAEQQADVFRKRYVPNYLKEGSVSHWGRRLPSWTQKLLQILCLIF